MLQSRFARTGLIATAVALSFGGVAKATFIIDFNQVGGNVVGTGSGSLDTSDLGAPFVYISAPVGVEPDLATFVAGDSVANGYELFFTTIAGPSEFGPGTTTYASSASGDSVVLAAFENEIATPIGYVSENPLTDSETFSGQTFASLGLTPGSYTYTFGTGADTDSIIVNIGVSSPSVPEPASIAAAGLVLPGLFLFAWKRRKLMA
jgi:hypothetical protein